MPFYEYRRPDGTVLEVMQKMTDPPLTEDPETGVPLERIFHPIAVHFKGKGFYNTDYGTKKRQREQAAKSEDSKKSDAKSGDAKSGESASSSSDSSSGGDSSSSSSSSSESVSKAEPAQSSSSKSGSSASKSSDS